MNETTKREIRSTECELAIRELAPDAQGEPSRTIVGRAIVFNAQSEVLDDWGSKFREIIAPEAVTSGWLATQDVKLNLLHDRGMTIARCNKGKAGSSLRLSVDPKGVTFEFDAPRCDLGDRALALVRSGVYSGCSFEFLPQDYEVDKSDPNSILITHRRFRKLTAITIGMDPAYSATSVNARELSADADPQAAPEEAAPDPSAHQEGSEGEDGKRLAREMSRRRATMARLAAFD